MNGKEHFERLVHLRSHGLAGHHALLRHGSAHPALCEYPRRFAGDVELRLQRLDRRKGETLRQQAALGLVRRNAVPPRRGADLVQLHSPGKFDLAQAPSSPFSNRSSGWLRMAPSSARTSEETNASAEDRKSTRLNSSH